MMLVVSLRMMVHAIPIRCKFHTFDTDDDDDDKKVGFSRLPSPPPVRLVGGQKLIGKWSQFSLLPYLAMIIIHLCLASSIIIFISIQHHLPE